MTRDEAVRLANDYVAQQMGPEPRFAGKRCELVLMAANLDKRNLWNIIYQINLPDFPGSVVDGPTIVVVDPVSRKACFLDELFR